MTKKGRARAARIVGDLIFKVRSCAPFGVEGDDEIECWFG